METKNQPKTINYGFIKPLITKEHFVLGSGNVPFVEHRPDGNWFNSRPNKELQSTNFETYNCTGFNTAAQIECYMKEVFGIEANYSDRWIGIIAGTEEPGNDPHVVYEAIRKNGLIPDSMLPWSSDIQNVYEYYSFKGGDEALCRAEGKKWLEQWDFKHEWVNTETNSDEEKEHNFQVALKSSPLALSVYAWYQDQRGVYVALGDENHWTFSYFKDKYRKIDDSYEPTLKDVDQTLNFCKRIWIGKKEVPSPTIQPIKVSLLEMFVAWVKRQFALLRFFQGTASE